MTELPAPPEALSAKDGSEVCRLWLGDGSSHVTLDYGIFGEDDASELRVWGMLIADIAAHTVRAALMNSPQLSSEAANAMLEQGFRERLAHNPINTGAFTDKPFH